MKTLLIGLGALALAGCGLGEWAEKKANKALQDELKKESEKSAKDDDGDKADKKADKSDDAAGGETWTETVTGSKVKLARVDLDAGGLAGMSILAPDGAKVAKSLGGNGADISEHAYGFSIWVTEDPTADMDLMKKGAAAFFKDSKLENEDDNSFIIAAKSYDGSSAYYYRGLFKSDGKIYRCETQSSTAPTEKSHAEQVDKVCESLQKGGKSIASKGEAPAEKAEEKEAAKETAAAEPAEVAATKPASQSAPSKPAEKKAEAPKPEAPKTEPAKPAEPPKPEPAKAADKGKDGGGKKIAVGARK